MAITTAVTNKNTSQRFARPLRAIFAETGPITHKRNAENAPRKAIMELNSGTRIDTATERKAYASQSETAGSSESVGERSCRRPAAVVMMTIEACTTDSAEQFLSESRELLIHLAYS